MSEQKQILALSPHTDDAELGAGASIARWIEEGHKVYIYAFSTGDLFKGAEYTEYDNSVETLGVTDYDAGDFPCHLFPQHRQEILEKLLELRDSFNPDIVLCPATWDTHQDHQVVCIEAIRAFKRDCSIYGYDVVWNEVLGSRLGKFVEVKSHHIHKKMKAIKHYESQAQRPMMDVHFLQGLMRVRGVQSGFEFAEAFEVIRERG